MKTAFGDMYFDTGWKTNYELELFGYSCSVLVKVKAYYEKDGITKEQQAACKYFLEHEQKLMAKAEELLDDYGKSDVVTPTMLVIQPDGEIALLLDDEEDEDNGMAVVLYPEPECMTQDEYL